MKNLIHFSSISITPCDNIWCPVTKTNVEGFIAQFLIKSEL